MSRWKEKTKSFWHTQYYSEEDGPSFCEEWSPAICTNGVALPLSQRCNGRCNFYPEDPWRNADSSRSHLPACSEANSCVKEGEGKTGWQSWQTVDVTYIHNTFKQTMCTGIQNCDGELTWCQMDERRNEACLQSGHTRCVPTLGGGKRGSNDQVPGQCIEENKARDGMFYHCMDRTDENPFQKEYNENSQQIDLDKLENCKYGDGTLQGLKCSVDFECTIFSHWCKDDFAYQCPMLSEGILTNDPKLCRDIKFWRDQPCHHDYVRCQAEASGQCVEKTNWGNDRADPPYRQHGGMTGCKDGSDLQRPIVKPDELRPQPIQQVWKLKPEIEEHYKLAPQDFLDEFFYQLTPKDHIDMLDMRKADHTKYQKDNPTGLWMLPENDPFKVPSISEEDYMRGPAVGDRIYFGYAGWNIRKRNERWATFYSSDDYMKDETTYQMVAAVTEKTCNDYNGFVCKVKIYDVMLIATVAIT